MAFFFDSSDIDIVRKYHRMGIVRGVTTNPSILLKAFQSGRFKNIKAHCSTLADIISPLPLSVEVITNDRNKMLEQAQEFSSWGKNINIKITIHGPEGELDNMEVIHELEHKYNIRVNVTAIMSAQQCYLAALAGATYVSLFGGRINNMGYNAIDEIKKTRSLLTQLNLQTKIIVGSTREVLNVTEWLLAGAHIVTVLPEFIEKMIVHPYSKETIQAFLNDAKKLS